MATIALATSHEFTRMTHQCLGYVNRYGDGLSIDHLAALLPKTPRSLLREALAFLTDSEQIIHANDDWYYPMEEPKSLESAVSVPQLPPKTDLPTMTTPTTEPLSTFEKIRHWFERRDAASAPINLKELTELCGVNRDTVTKALKKLLDEFRSTNPEKAKQLDDAIQRRKVKNISSSWTKRAPKPKVSRKMVTGIAEIAVPEPKFPILKFQDEKKNWVEEFRNHLIAKRLPDHAQEWHETLQQMDRVFAELGMPDSQRARKHVQEMIAWLIT